MGQHTNYFEVTLMFLDIQMNAPITLAINKLVNLRQGVTKLWNIPKNVAITMVTNKHLPLNYLFRCMLSSR